MNRMHENAGCRTLPEQIADQLEYLILSEDPVYSGKLPSESALAESFGVSRPVIREALTLLHGRDLIVAKNGEGSFIRTPSAEDLAQTLNRIVSMKNIPFSDLFAVRTSLEITAIRAAAEGIGQDGIERLRELNREMAEIVSDPETRARADVRFHEQIAKESGNELLYLTVSAVSVLLLPAVMEALNAPGGDRLGVSGHDAIIACLEACVSGRDTQTACENTEKAVECLRRHLLFSALDYETAQKN